MECRCPQGQCGAQGEEDKGFEIGQGSSRHFVTLPRPLVLPSTFASFQSFEAVTCSFARLTGANCVQMRGICSIEKVMSLVFKYFLASFPLFLYLRALPRAFTKPSIL